MLNKRSFSILFASLLMSSLVGCGGSTANVEVPTSSAGAQLESISITPTNPSLAVNTSQQCTATGIFSDNTTKDLTSSVTWTSSNADTVDVVSGNDAAGLSSGTIRPGYIIAKHPGCATIWAKWQSKWGAIDVTVTPATLVSIAITPTNPSISIGTTQQVAATGTFSDNTTQDLTTAVIWSSSSTTVATISNAAGSHGLATSVAAGTTTIKATSGNISGATTLTVTSATLVSIAITPTNPTIVKGTTQQFTATGTYSDNTTQDLTAAATWSSSPSGIASISNAAGSNGLATSTGAGSTTITAAWGGLSGTTTLTVTPATLVSIAITPTNPSIAKGTTKQFTATGTYSDSSTQNLTTAVAWSSSLSGIASISNAAGSNGLATSTGAGSTTITAASGGISGTTTLTVTPATLVSIAITPTNPSIAKGTTKQFTAAGTYSDSSTQNLTTAVAWSASPSGIASISNAAGSNGLATSTGAGSTTITAASGGISGTTTLTVTPATLVSIAITPTNPSIAKGTTKQFTAAGTYSDSSTQNLTTAVAWSASPSGIASISNAAGSNGLATSTGAGSTTITAASGGISGTTTLTVTPATLVSIAITPTNPSIVTGATKQFTATGTYSDSSTQNLTTAVAWSASPSGIASISNAAGSNGLATGTAAGTTTITATSGGVSGTATLTVTGGGGVVTLKWDAPTTNTDGSSLDPLTGLSTYKIYYGTAPHMYTQVVNVANPGTTTITQTLNLSSGTYYFAVTTVNITGQESSYSNEAMKTI